MARINYKTHFGIAYVVNEMWAIDSENRVMLSPGGMTRDLGTLFAMMVEGEDTEEDRNDASDFDDD